MARFYITLLALTVNSLAYSQCDSLFTLYEESNGQDGIMFDIVASSDVTINGFDTSLEDTIYPYTIHVYFKQGTHVGFDQNSQAWTFIDSVSGIMSTGLDTPTAIPIVINQAILEGDSMAFYITENGQVGTTNLILKYSDGTALGNVYSTDGVISILEGTGKRYPFDNSYQPRIPNVTVHYSCGIATDLTHTGISGDLLLYPNPTTSHIRIQLPENNLKATRTRVYDMTGRLVHQQSFNPNMDVGYLDNGTYIIVVETDEGNFRGIIQKE